MEALDEEEEQEEYDCQDMQGMLVNVNVRVQGGGKLHVQEIVWGAT